MLKMVADIAFYYFFANLVAAGLFGAHESLALYSMIVFAVCSLVCIAVYYRFENKKLRFLPLVLLTGNYFILPLNIAGIILITLPAFYVVYSTVKLRDFTGHFYYNSVFMFFIKIFLPASVLLSLVSTVRINYYAHSLPFALMFLTAAVVLMRMARHNPQVHTQWWFRLMNLISLGMVFVMGLLTGSQQLVSFVRGLIVTVFRDWVYPFLLLVLEYFLIALHFLLGFMFEMRVPSSGEKPLEAELDGYAEELFDEALQNREVFDNILMVIFVIIGVLILLLLFKRLRSIEMKKASSTGQYIYTADRAKVNTDGVRNPMRKIYRRFLRLCYRRGLAEKTYFTSKDYETQATAKFELGEEAEKLRNLYIPVRYDGKHTKKEEIAAARELYKKIRIKSKK
jgi:hypothetical protein